MNIEINISNEKIVNFSENAKTELTKQTNRIVNEIIDEASRIEATRRISGTNSEVTQSNVKEVAIQPHLYFRHKNTWGVKIIQITAFITTSIAGALFDIDKFKSESHVIWFIILSLIAISTTVYLIFNQENNG